MIKFCSIKINLRNKVFFFFFFAMNFYCIFNLVPEKFYELYLIAAKPDKPSCLNFQLIIKARRDERFLDRFLWEIKVFK